MTTSTVLDSPHARSVLPLADYADGAAPRLLCGQPRQRLTTPGFELHECLALPDLPPLKDGSQSSAVHRFVLAPGVASEINAGLQREAAGRMSGLRRLLGETKSNMGGYHSLEEAFTGEARAPLPQPPGPVLHGPSSSLLPLADCWAQAPHEWYGALLSRVLFPALRALDGQGMGGHEAVDACGVPLEGRISGALERRQ